MRNQKGITLIALVITIIVLLILAGVSIAMLTGDNGILTKASTSNETNSIAQIKEDVSLAISEIMANKADPTYTGDETTVDAATITKIVKRNDASLTSVTAGTDTEATSDSGAKHTLVVKLNKINYDVTYTEKLGDTAASIVVTKSATQD